MNSGQGVVALVLLGIVGCGRAEYQKTLSVVNTEADRWDGDAKFTSEMLDAYGNRLQCKITKGPLNYVLEVRSTGADGLPKNDDDIFVEREKSHTTFTEKSGKFMERVTEGAASGAVKGVKKVFGKPADDPPPAEEKK